MSSINKLCYCGQDLIHDPEDLFTFPCRSCCKQMTHAQNYWCNDGSCKYKEMSGQTYIICTDCHGRNDSEYKYDDADVQDLFVKKFLNSMNITRLVALSRSAPK